MANTDDIVSKWPRWRCEVHQCTDPWLIAKFVRAPDASEAASIVRRGYGSSLRVDVTPDPDVPTGGGHAPRPRT